MLRHGAGRRSLTKCKSTTWAQFSPKTLQKINRTSTIAKFPAPTTDQISLAASLAFCTHYAVSFGSCQGENGGGGIGRGARTRLKRKGRGHLPTLLPALAGSPPTPCTCAIQDAASHMVHSERYCLLDRIFAACAASNSITFVFSPLVIPGPSRNTSPRSSTVTKGSRL